MSKKKGRKKPLPLRIVLWFLGIVLGLVVVVLATVTITEYRPADVEPLEVTGEASRTLRAGDSIRLMSWNIGYGCLGDNADFFMDGGTMVKTADSARIRSNLDGIGGVIRDETPDILLLQEVDHSSTRSEHVDEQAEMAALLPGTASSFARNYKALYVPYPMPPIGQVDSGIETVSAFPAASAERVKLPSPFKWPVSTVNLKRCLMVTRIPVEGSEHEMVVINLHLEAYDDGDGKIAQTAQLVTLLREEAAKGNWVIAGGDFNQVFSTTDMSGFPVLEGKWQPGRIDVSALAGDFTFLQSNDAASCRSLDRPLDGAAEKDPQHFQYYQIDGFIVSNNVRVDEFAVRELGFAVSDHEPLVLCVTLE